MEELSMDDFNKELKNALHKERQELAEMTNKLRSSRTRREIINQKRFLLELIIIKMDLVIGLTPEDYNIISEYDS